MTGKKPQALGPVPARDESKTPAKTGEYPAEYHYPGETIDETGEADE
jgi:hypothetical protein